MVDYGEVMCAGRALDYYHVSWFSAVAEVGTGIVFAAVGIRAAKTQSFGRGTVVALWQVRDVARRAVR